MTVKDKQLDEKIQTGGGATGVAHNVDPEGGKATLPKSSNNSESMDSVDASKVPGQSKDETSSENNTKPTGDNAAKNKSSVAMKEHMDAMFQGSDLSEEFKEQATVIFEAAVTARVSDITEELEEQYNTALTEEVERIEAELTEKVDQYMNYVTEQWMEDNKVAIQSSLKSDITEGFINDLKNLFEANYISVPEEKFDIVEGVQAELAEVQQRLDAVLEENMALKGEVNESVRAKILADVTEGLADTQAERLVTLAEGVQFDSADNYRKKLEIVKENYFPTDKPASNAQSLLENLQEQDDQKTSAPTNGPVNIYAQAISRTVKK
jgi:hypothetical protein